MKGSSLRREPDPSGLAALCFAGARAGGSLSDCLWNGTENTPGTSRALHYSARVPKKKKRERERGQVHRRGERRGREEGGREEGWKSWRVKTGGAQCHPRAFRNH